MKIYYAHAMPTYRTTKERTEKTLIRKLFPKHIIVDPGTYQENIQKRKEGMAYCLKLVRNCNALAFSRYRGEINVGVGKEVNYALDNNLQVYELLKSRIKAVKSPIKHLSMEETLELYYPDRKFL